MSKHPFFDAKIEDTSWDQFTRASLWGMNYFFATVMLIVAPPVGLVWIAISIALAVVIARHRRARYARNAAALAAMMRENNRW